MIAARCLLVGAVFSATLAAVEPACVQADAIVVSRAMSASTIAEIFVQADEVRVELEIGTADIRAFRNVLPDESYLRLTGETKPLGERLTEFLREDWIVRAGDSLLEGRVASLKAGRRVKRDEITGQPLANQPKDAEVVIQVELVYPLQSQPQTLSLQPPMSERTGGVAANVGFVLYHQGVAVNDFLYLSQRETVQLDWDDPWYSAFDRRTLKRRYDAPAAAFLYVDHFEVRKEIIFRARDLQSWVDLGLDGKSIITAGERAEICRRAAEFLDKHTPVTVDGRLVEGALDRVNFVERTLRSSGVVDPAQDVDVNTALIGAIYIYPVQDLPNLATMDWDLFNDRIQRVPSVATDEAGGLPSDIEPRFPQLEWKNYLTHPTRPALLEVPVPPEGDGLRLPWLVALVSVGVIAYWIVRMPSLLRRSQHAESTSEAATVVRRKIVALSLVSGAILTAALILMPWTSVSVDWSQDEARAIETRESMQIAGGLLHNVYRAFDYRDESVIYDVLDQSVAGDLLPTVYLETRKSLTLASQGGARVKVEDVELLACEVDSPADDSEFIATCVWDVTGSIGHWGHLHQRRNRYRAELAIRSIDGQWKIADMQVLEESRTE